MGQKNQENIITTGIVLSGTFLVMLNQQLLSPALPAVMKDFEVSAASVQWLQSAYALIIALLVPLSAFFLGRFTTRRLFCGSLLLFFTGSAVCVFSPVFGGVLAGRMIQACSAGVLMPMCITVLMLSFPKEKRGTAMGVTTLIMGAAPALGPALSGIFVDSFGWRAVFVLSSALSLLIFITGIVFLRNFEGFHRSSFDVISVVLSSLGLLGILYGLSTFSEEGKRFAAVVMIAAGLVILAFFVKRQMSLGEPLLNVGTLKVAHFRISAIAPAFMQAVLYGSMVLMPIFIQNILGCSAVVSGLVMIPGAVLCAITGYISGRIFDRCGVRVLAMTGSVLFAAGSICFALLPGSVHVSVVAAAYTLMAVSMQFVVTPLKTWGLNSLPDEQISHGTPIQNTFVSVGGSLGTAAVVSIGALAGTGPKAEYMQVHLGFCVMAVFALIYFVIISLFVKDR